MGGTRDKYIKYKFAGDQYLGRCLSGLDQLSYMFGCTPPFFDGDEQLQCAVDEFMHDHIPNGHAMNADHFKVFHMTLASVAYHYEYIDKLIDEKSSI